MVASAHRGRRSREWWCRFTLQVFALCFAVAGAQFLFFPDETVATINAVGAWLGDFPPAPPSALRFWLSLATGYMALIAALAYLAQRDLRRQRDMIALLVLGKATTALVALGFYWFATGTFVYLLNFVVDGAIALLVLAIWTTVPSLGPEADRPLSSHADRPPHRSEPVLSALLEAMIPPGGPFAEGADDRGSARDVDALITGLGPRAERALRLGIGAMEFVPFLVPPVRLRRYSRLPLEDRIHLLETWEQSRLLPLRQLVQALKMLVMGHFYARPGVEARLGYPQPLERVPPPDVTA